MRRVLILLSAAALLVAFTGCGKSSKKTVNTPFDTAGANAEAGLGNDALAQGNVAAANQHYKNALAKDPTHPTANLGAGLTELYLVQDDPQVQDIVAAWQAYTPAPPAARRATDARSRRLASILGRLSLTPRANYGPVAGGVALSRMLLLAGSNPPAISEMQQVIKTVVMPKLAYAEARLVVLESNPSVQIMLAPALTGASDSVEVDLGDIQLLDGIVNNIQGVLGIVVAYNFDVPSYEHVNAESLLAAGTDFGKLHPDGQAQLTAARLNFINATNLVEAAINGIEAEVDDQVNDLIPKDGLETLLNVDDALQSLSRLRSAFSGPVYVYFTNRSYQPDSERVNAGRFFTPAIADLKTKLPDHTFDPTTHDPILTQPINFPDPTFNLIFPDMTNARLRELSGN